jgi:hypothetical protein
VHGPRAGRGDRQALTSRQPAQARLHLCPGPTATRRPEAGADHAPPARRHGNAQPARCQSQGSLPVTPASIPGPAAGPAAHLSHAVTPATGHCTFLGPAGPGPPLRHGTAAREGCGAGSRRGAWLGVRADRLPAMSRCAHAACARSRHGGGPRTLFEGASKTRSAPGSRGPIRLGAHPVRGGRSDSERTRFEGAGPTNQHTSFDHALSALQRLRVSAECLAWSSITVFFLIEV